MIHETVNITLITHNVIIPYLELNTTPSATQLIIDLTNETLTVAVLRRKIHGLFLDSGLFLDNGLFRDKSTLSRNDPFFGPFHP